MRFVLFDSLKFSNNATEVIKKALPANLVCLKSKDEIQESFDNVEDEDEVNDKQTQREEKWTNSKWIDER